MIILRKLFSKKIHLREIPTDEGKELYKKLRKKVVKDAIYNIQNSTSRPKKKIEANSALNEMERIKNNIKEGIEESEKTISYPQRFESSRRK